MPDLTGSFNQLGDTAPKWAKIIVQPQAILYSVSEVSQHLYHETIVGILRAIGPRSRCPDR